MSLLIEQAVKLLTQGELVAFPTETVYGLGADATNPEAVKKIFEAKGRPTDHPVIVHLAKLEQLTAWAKNISPLAWQLAEQFWPGPMTLILSAQANVSPLVTGQQPTIGLRIPAHPLAQCLLREFNRGIAAPSANRFGRISPTTAAHVQQELGAKVALILDGGPCAVGIESTIIDVSTQQPRLLRPGMLNLQEIMTRTGIKLDTLNLQNIPRVSGSLESHYAPQTPLYLISLAEIENYLARFSRVAVIARQPAPKQYPQLTWQQLPDQPAAYAHALYASLRAVDTQTFAAILVELPPENTEWQAIYDRLRRAAIK